VAGCPKGLSQRAEPLWTALSKPHPDGGRVSNVSLELRVVAMLFVALHAARQSADYDHTAEFSKETALEYVNSANAAADWLGKHAADADFQRFFAWIVARASGFKR
jgi:hypothetical protein